jgi:hypothetical protein
VHHRINPGRTRPLRRNTKPTSRGSDGQLGRETPRKHARLPRILTLAVLTLFVAAIAITAFLLLPTSLHRITAPKPPNQPMK